MNARLRSSNLLTNLLTIRQEIQISFKGLIETFLSGNCLDNL